MTINGLAYVFQEVVLATTSDLNLEHNIFLGQTSSIMRVSTSRDGDLLSQFDNIKEANGDDDFDSTYLTNMLINNQTPPTNKGKIKGQLPLERIFGFCKIFKKVTKNLGFHITLKTAGHQNIFFTSKADGVRINVTINSLFCVSHFL